MTNNALLEQPINVILINAYISSPNAIIPGNIKNSKRVDKRHKYLSFQNKYNIIDENNNYDNEYRPDILFFSILALQDSIVNKKKLLNLYITTNNGQLIRVSNTFRVPRTYNLFLKVLKMLINSEDHVLKSPESNEILLEILPENVNDYIKNDTKIIITDNDLLVDLRKFLISKSAVINNIPFTFIINVGPLPDYNIPFDSKNDQSNNFVLPEKEYQIINSINNVTCDNNKNSNDHDLNISLSTINLTASAKCFKLVCDLEHVFNL